MNKAVKILIATMIAMVLLSLVIGEPMKSPYTNAVFFVMALTTFITQIISKLSNENK